MIWIWSVWLPKSQPKNHFFWTSIWIIKKNCISAKKFCDSSRWVFCRDFFIFSDFGNDWNLCYLNISIRLINSNFPQNTDCPRTEISQVMLRGWERLNLEGRVKILFRTPSMCTRTTYLQFLKVKNWFLKIPIS